MKLTHEYYDIEDLCEYWSESKVTEKNILKWGIEGALQFFVWIDPGSYFCLMHLKNLENTFLNFTDEECKRRKPNIQYYSNNNNTIIPYGKKKLFPLKKRTVVSVLDKKRVKITPKISVTCDDCQALEVECKKSKFRFCVLEYKQLYENDFFNSEFKMDDSSILNITKNDLYTTKEEVKRFEKKNYFEQEETIPLYLDPKNEFYSVTLDLAVRTWKAIFIDKKFHDKNSAATAGKEYLMSPDSGCSDLMEANNMKLNPTLAKAIGKIAVAQYNPDKKKWNKFRKKE